VDDLDVLTVDYTQSDNNGIVQPVVVPITDSIAPVLIDAWFRPAVVTDPDNVPDDTITLTFSEPVGEISFDRPVTLRGKDGEYTMLLRDPVPAGDRSVRFIVDSIVGTEFPAAGDEAWVNPDAGVVDRSSARNVQTRKSEPVSLRVRPYEYVFSVSVLPGHGDPRITRIPDALRSAAGISETHGMALVVRPTGKVAEQANISAKISIFDAVGNMVLKDRTATPNQSRDYFTFVWDGVNENGRMVGTGTYLAVVIIRDDNGISALRRMKIGVKR
jgi:hypothetical protein